MKKKKVLILNDGTSYENWGIKACIDGLKLILKESITDCEFIGISHAYINKKYNVEPKIFGKSVLNENSRIASRFFKKYHVIPRIADEFEYVTDQWRAGNGGDGAKSILEAINSVDVVVFNAEGSVYRKNYGAIKGLFLLWIAKTVCNKPSYFLNGSITLTSVDSVLPAMVEKVFSVIDGACVREPTSLSNLTDYCPKLSSVKMFPDSVFSLDLMPSETSKKIIDLEFNGNDYFCFSLSMLPMDFSLSKERSRLVSLIVELKKVVPNAVLLAKDVEDQLLNEVANLTDSFFVGKDFSYRDVSELLSNSKFLLSGRYHHLIFATKVGCPSIPLFSSSHKIHGLSKLFEGLMIPPLDPTNLNVESEAIIDEAKRIMTEGEQLRNEILTRASELSAMSFEQGKLISND